MNKRKAKYCRVLVKSKYLPDLWTPCGRPVSRVIHRFGVCRIHQEAFTIEGKDVLAVIEFTGRELQVACGISLGLRNKEIARELGCSERTAKFHVGNLLRKLGFTDRIQIGVWYIKNERHLSSENNGGNHSSLRP